MGVEALGIYGIPDSLYALVDILRGPNPPPYLRDTVILAMSTIIDTQSQFYPLLARFIAEPRLVAALALDEAESACEYYAGNSAWRSGRIKNELPLLAQQAENLRGAVASLVQESAASGEAVTIETEAPTEIAGNIEPASTGSKRGVALSRWILELPDFPFLADQSFTVAQTVFSESLLDDELISHRRLQLLIVHWAAYQIRTWIKGLKR
jgi:hypothetical protein